MLDNATHKLVMKHFGQSSEYRKLQEKEPGCSHAVECEIEKMRQQLAAVHTNMQVS